MAESFDFHTPFDTQGLFSAPSSDFADIPGRLIYNANGIVLEKCAHVVGIDQLSPSEIEHFDTILGVTVGADNCSLFDIFSTNHGPGVSLESDKLLTTTKYTVGGCVFGVHLKSKSEPIIASADFRYAGLENWFGSGIRPQKQR